MKAERYRTSKLVSSASAVVVLSLILPATTAGSQDQYDWLRVGDDENWQPINVQIHGAVGTGFDHFRIF